jgi:hypothetical protein
MSLIQKSGPVDRNPEALEALICSGPGYGEHFKLTPRKIPAPVGPKPGSPLNPRKIPKPVGLNSGSTSVRRPASWCAV